MAFCSKCGKNVDEGTNFCPSCGAAMNTASAGSVPNNQFSNVDVTKKFNMMILIGFILGVVSLFLNFFGIVGILACVFSGMGLAKFNDKTENYKWMGYLGIVLGVIGVIYAFYKLITA
ncbi:MAG: zinc-ribbon domain-containing protein [Treponema sp.]|nr:zinc-ribbon domain-containing protein [Treponema sp.]